MSWQVAYQSDEETQLFIIERNLKNAVNMDFSWGYLCTVSGFFDRGGETQADSTHSTNQYPVLLQMPANPAAITD